MSPPPGQAPSPVPWCHPPTPGGPLGIQAPTPSATPVANGGLTPSMDSWAPGCQWMQRGGLIFWNLPGHPQKRNIGNQRESSRSDNLRSLEISLENKCGLKINTAPGPAVLPGHLPHIHTKPCADVHLSYSSQPHPVSAQRTRSPMAVLHPACWVSRD